MRLSEWKLLSRPERERYLNALLIRLGNRFQVDQFTIGQDYPCIIYTNKLNIRYRLIFEHNSGFGLSTQCLEKAKKINVPLQITVSELTPFSIVNVPSYAISETPLLECDIDMILDNFCVNNPSYPAFLTREKSKEVLDMISARFLSELEWEAAVKNNQDVLFPFGDELPKESDLEWWMSFNFNKFRHKRIGNNICGLFFGEWCADLFSKNHSQDSEIVNGEYVIKGGAAYFWPWQDEEWVWCMCSMRMPSGDLIDGTSVLRPAITIPTNFSY
ncbi:hypothetical protein [Neisseria zalophi]|uniref:Uncharacterized protein n=1 Tax=Neisseria zalophi TaxID=640030 RepID=A0A5J6PZN4_9NEIS|nr:hypothetical protein [Neisseria zalophi]QEY26180.1 hypothetical protein D0T92_06340 [Neisseria zalophi]